MTTFIADAASRGLGNVAGVQNVRGSDSGAPDRGHETPDIERAAAFHSCIRRSVQTRSACRDARRSWPVHSFARRRRPPRLRTPSADRSAFEAVAKGGAVVRISRRQAATRAQGRALSAARISNWLCQFRIDRLEVRVAPVAAQDDCVLPNADRTRQRDRGATPARVAKLELT